ncbi:dehydrogenase/reductase SDR family member on chromosome X isoform X5 [Pezoporus occidentalis]|uniref:dehydrogenase/reductase SDR family member on chromosome X isoform X5 n=1 Tax=Pezoporus occidentalis TaxID=407982 RepID=UPI002F910DB7
MPRRVGAATRPGAALTAAALSLPLGGGRAAPRPPPRPCPARRRRPATAPLTGRLLACRTPSAPRPEPAAAGREAAMSLLSAPVPLLRVYWIGLLVILHQLRHRLLPRCPPTPAGNSESEGQEAVRKIQEETSSGKAGVMLVPERKTEDGFEEHFGLNYLGHFLLTNLLLDKLRQSGTHSHNARIITVSSATHYVGKLHLSDLQSRCSYSPHGAYAQSKLALVLFTYQLQHLLAANGSHVTANVVDPGVVNTELYKHVFWVVKVAKWMTAWLFFKTPEEGASTTIYAAVSPEMEGVGGCYLYNEERTKSADVAYDEELQRRLWTESCKMVGISD